MSDFLLNPQLKQSIHNEPRDFLDQLCRNFFAVCSVSCRSCPVVASYGVGVEFWKESVANASKYSHTAQWFPTRQRASMGLVRKGL